MSGIRRVGVLGFGQMGSGIAQVCAVAGVQTVVLDVSPDLVESGLAAIGKRLARLEEKAVISTAERAAAMSRLRGTVEIGELADSDLVIEAIVEDLEVKNRVWRELDGVCPAETIFASNTSSLTIADMAAATSRPERLIGLHFFNPVPVMGLVEIVPTLVTETIVVQRASDFVRAIGKEPTECRDRSGFLVNRLLVPYMMDAIRALEQGLGTIESIDRAMRLGAGHPMGPLTLCDFVGNDTLDRIGEIMYLEYREARFASPPLLKRMISLGLFGRKSDKGFYDYSEDPPVPLVDLR